ncbi:hypothetical protein GCM10029978_026700 [Actinoallomurus acanthiterrae]
MLSAVLDLPPITRPTLRVVGEGVPVPVAGGRTVPYANLDYAASAPCLEAVRDALDAALPYYSSVHRGAGYASQVTTDRYERAREVVREFVGAWRRDAVVFTRNTTDAMNLLAHALPRGTTVVVFESEHHASLLPWQRGNHVVRLAAPESPAAALAAAGEALAAAPAGPRLLVVTAASNVTGELWPVAELAAVARAHGARIAVDAAQLVPHRPFDMGALDVDYVAFSGHKLYAPFGAGCLVGRADWLRAAEPYLLGGGATASVGEHVTWSADPQQRHEAGHAERPRRRRARSRVRGPDRLGDPRRGGGASPAAAADRPGGHPRRTGAVAVGRRAPARGHRVVRRRGARVPRRRHRAVRPVRHRCAGREVLRAPVRPATGRRRAGRLR